MKQYFFSIFFACQLIIPFVNAQSGISEYLIKKNNKIQNAFSFSTSIGTPKEMKSFWKRKMKNLDGEISILNKIRGVSEIKNVRIGQNELINLTINMTIKIEKSGFRVLQVFFLPNGQNISSNSHPDYSIEIETFLKRFKNEWNVSATNNKLQNSLKIEKKLNDDLNNLDRRKMKLEKKVIYFKKLIIKIQEKIKDNQETLQTIKNKLQDLNDSTTVEEGNVIKKYFSQKNTLNRNHKRLSKKLLKQRFSVQKYTEEIKGSKEKINNLINRIAKKKSEIDQQKKSTQAIQKSMNF